MKNKEKSEKLSKSASLIEDALSVLDNIEDDRSERDKKITSLYYKALEVKDDLDFLADSYEAN